MFPGLECPRRGASRIATPTWRRYRSVVVAHSMKFLSYRWAIQRLSRGLRWDVETDDALRLTSVTKRIFRLREPRISCRLENFSVEYTHCCHRIK